MDFDRPPAGLGPDIKGVGVRAPQAQGIETEHDHNSGQGTEDTPQNLRPAPAAQRPDHSKQSGSLGEQGVGPQSGHVGEDQAVPRKGEHERVLQILPAVLRGEGLPHDPGREGAAHQIQDGGGDLYLEPGGVQAPKDHQLQKKRPGQPLIFYAKQLFGGDFKAHFHHAVPPEYSQR